jgi:glutamate synthase (NADPH) large chain
VVENGIDALKAVWHRGAVDADGKTGDGAGIHVQIPVAFFYDQIRRTGPRARPTADRRGPGVPAAHRFRRAGTLPHHRRDRSAAHGPLRSTAGGTCRWTSVLGEKANATRPEIEQILIRNAKGMDEEAFERELYVIRRRIEKAAAAAQIQGLYLCSLSCRSIIYKGMMLAEQVAEFYPDLKDERFESAFAIYHQRYSTNTFPQWWLAQPFRMLAHNGEINTLKGNLNWMKSHEIRMASNAFGEMAEDIKPIVPQGASDSRRAGCGVRGAGARGPQRADGQDHAGARGLVEAGGRDAAALAGHVRLLQRGDGALGRPGGAGDDRRPLGLRGLDRNGLRPMRYVVTGDGLLIAGSEAGHGAGRREPRCAKRARWGRAR